MEGVVYEPTDKVVEEGPQTIFRVKVVPPPYSAQYSRPPSAVTLTLKLYYAFTFSSPELRVTVTVPVPLLTESVRLA